MFFVKIRVSARLPGASVLYGGGVPDAPRRGKPPPCKASRKKAAILWATPHNSRLTA